MRDYLLYIPSARAEYCEREEIEWSNFWIDKANENIGNRILLIGDSTARMVRSTLANLSNKPVDLLASSSSLHDSLFVNQVKCFFSESLYTYDTIFIQFGHHGELGIGGSAFNETDWALFEEEFRGLCQYLLQFSNKIIVESIFIP